MNPFLSVRPKTTSVISEVETKKLEADEIIDSRGRVIKAPKTAPRLLDKMSREDQIAKAITGELKWSQRRNFNRK